MKIQIIGTGGITSKDNPACLMVDDHILLDCGNGIVKALMKGAIDIYKIDTLLITHLHGDHFLDVPFLVLPRGFIPVNNTLRIICPKGTAKRLSVIKDLIYDDIEPFDVLCDKGRVVIEEFEDDTEFETEGYTIKAVRTDHGDCLDAYGYLISDYQSTLGVSGDSTMCEGIIKIMDEADVAVMDSSFPSQNASHMGADTLIALAEKYPNKAVVATHMNDRTMYERCGELPFNLVIPQDYDILHI